MLRTTIRLLSIVVICLSATPAYSCVGRTLYIGSLTSQQDKLMSEMLALLINERTGTTVKTRYFDNNNALYKAMQSDKEEGRVDIMVEDTIDALQFLKKAPGASADDDYLTAKKLYDKSLDIIWLNPFGYSNGRGTEHKSVSAPLVRRDVLTNFPLLPRVLNKLSGVISDKAYKSLNKKVSDGEKPLNVAKAFLKKTKLI